MKDGIFPLANVILPQALDLCRRVFLESLGPDYSPQGIDSFLRFLAPEQMERMISSGLLTFFGCWTDDVLTGVGALRHRQHISLLFVEKGFQGQGIGSALLEAMAETCRQAGSRELTVHAAPPAAGFYQKRGFRPAAGEQTADGIRFISMIRPLKGGTRL